MAEIYLTRQASSGAAGGATPFDAGGVPGGGKEVVVKRLKPDLAGDPRVVAMFRDEARISAALNHPYVVQVFDVGEQDDTPFIAMEYIRGEELNQLCRRGLAAGAFLPLRHAVELCRQAAMALGYIHALRDADGKSLDIVHCDVSPTNFLVTEDGFLKVIDFGIARARGLERRDERVLPGKLSYMSPEQARREPIDHRSDIFSLGVVLYEITLGQRLFKGPAQEVFERLARCDVKPPTFVRRDFPGVLESIIMRALEAEPGERYASAFDMADELDEFLRDSSLSSGSLRIARYLDQLAVAAGGERRPELVPEREEGEGDEALDFDRGLFEGYQAASPEQAAARAADWDEYEEPEQAVADALGVDLGLMKTAAVSGGRRLRIEEDEGDDDDDDDDQPTVEAAPAGSRAGAGPGGAADSRGAAGLPPHRQKGGKPPALHRAPTAPPQPRTRRRPAPAVPDEVVLAGSGPPWHMPTWGWFALGLAAGAAVVLLLRLFVA